jgi:hypothetical protein
VVVVTCIMMGRFSLVSEKVSAALVVTVLCVAALSSVTVEAQLSPNYYRSRGCPNAVGIIQSAVLRAFNQNRASMAGVLRIHFHDCFVNVCTATALIFELASSAES